MRLCLRGGGILAIYLGYSFFQGDKHFFGNSWRTFRWSWRRWKKLKSKWVKDDIFDVGDFVIKDELYIHELQAGHRC